MKPVCFSFCLLSLFLVWSTEEPRDWFASVESQPIGRTVGTDDLMGAEKDSIQGWRLNHGKWIVADGRLKIMPAAKPRRSPFLTRSKIRLDAKTTLLLRIRSRDGKEAKPDESRFGVAWREQGQSGFPADQSVSGTDRVGPQWRTLSVDFEGQQPIIQLRVHLPKRGADVESIELRGPGNRVIQKWKFGQ